MKRPADLDVFAVYAGSVFRGSRAEIVAQALAKPRTRELVWLYLAVNEIPWKRLTVPDRLARALRQQGEKGTQIAAMWRTATRYCLDRPFRVWYVGRTRRENTPVSRSEAQRWREAVWFRRTQSSKSSVRSPDRKFIPVALKSRV
jgi:hypothetical protein